MYLSTRNGVYYFRRRLPEPLKAHASPEERSAFHHSLDTKDRKRAIELRSSCLAKSDHILTLLKSRASGMLVTASAKRGPRSRVRKKFGRSFYQLSAQEAQDLAVRWYGRELARLKEWALEVHLRWDDEFRKDAINQLIDELVLLRDDRTGNNSQLLYVEISSLMGEEDCEPPSEWLKHELFLRLYNRIHQGMIHHRETALEIVQNGIKESVPPLIPNDAAGLSLAPLHRGKTGKTLNEVIEIFKESPKRATLREATKDEYEPIFRLLREYFGADREMMSIKREHMRDFTALLRKLPAHASTKFGMLPLAELVSKAEQQNQRSIHPKTYNKKIHFVSSLFRFAETEEFIEKNPARELGLNIPKEQDEGKRFSIESLTKIFSGEVYLKFAATQAQFVPDHQLMPCMFWAPLIALFTGMRSNEILQLDTENGISEMEGIEVFKVLKTVKGHNSYRVIPLHPELNRLGLPLYLQKIREKNFASLFPDAQTAKYGKFSTWFQKPFAAYLKNIQVKTGRKECFHSFRHTFVGGLRSADVPEDIRKSLTGHSRRDSEEAFYGGEAHRRNAMHLHKLKYPGLDLSHLYPKSGTL